MKNQRRQELDMFLKNYFVEGIDSFQQIPGDAGFRSYFRLKHLSNSYIIMDCPPSYSSTIPFIEMANYLRRNGFSAPKIIAQDRNEGFLVLEDFGTTSLKTYLKSLSLENKKNIYFLMIDNLIELQNKETPLNLNIYNNQLLLSELFLFEEWYVPYVLKRKLSKKESLDYQNIWIKILNKQYHLKPSVVLRDYHVENIMYLETKKGIQSLGLLDFQDALIGSPIYDLASILEDARIEVTNDLAMECIKYFATSKDIPLDKILTNYHILGAQRNTRILGVFARKAIRDKNKNYLQYIPLVSKYLKNDLSHNIMSELKKWHEFYKIT